MSRRIAAAIALSLSLVVPAVAEDLPVLSTVSPADVAALMEGRDTGLAQLAEVHLWPSPRIVLEHAAELLLAADQLRTASKIEADMEAEAREVGREWLAAEAQLEEYFRSGRASKGKVTALVMQAGELHARLRALHLSANIQMRPHLTQKQLEIYSTFSTPTASSN